MMQLDLQRDAAERLSMQSPPNWTTLQQDCVQTLRGVDSIVNDAEDDEDLFDGVKGFKSRDKRAGDVGTALSCKQRRVNRSHRQRGGENGKSDERIAGGAARISIPRRARKTAGCAQKHRKSNRTDGLSLNALENGVLELEEAWRIRWKRCHPPCSRRSQYYRRSRWSEERRGVARSVQGHGAPFLDCKQL